jgi:drug/metabolite transporter (DMT)-like permease
MNRATLVGFVAIAAWALLALLTDMTGKVPPLQLLAITFAIGAVPGLVAMLAQPARRAALRQPLHVWALGAGGLFGYHFCYFTALDNAPAIDASLIAYLWPLFIVLGSALMPGERLKWHHVGGALLGLSGAALIVTKGGAVNFEARYAFGYAMAGLCALIWSSYSLLSRRNAAVPTDTVTGFCLMTAALGLAAHLLFEQTVWPQTQGEWTAITLLGLIPLGLAFMVWDYGVKHGDIQVLGAASYASPLLSTLVLIGAGRAEISNFTIAACLLITFGAVLAAKDMILGSGGAEAGEKRNTGAAISGRD